VDLLSGGEMIARALEDEGVEYIFGYPGGAVLHIYDALFKDCKVPHVLVRHEQAATHAADGYARATGKPGVVLVTSGPGATNAVTGIATAYMDSIPMVVISGQVQSHLVGQDAFQETDMVGISRPIVKHSFMVKRTEDLPSVIKKAFFIASTGRPGPVVIDIPKDITRPDAKMEYSYPESVKMRSYAPAQRGHTGQIKKAAKMLLAAKRPVIYTGGGVVQGEGSDLLTQLARELNYPVTNTLMGLGAFPGTDPQFLGMLGMHGFYEANMAMHHSDVILAVGARFDDRVTNTVEKFCPSAKIIHVDIDPAAISKTVMADIPIVGPVQSVLTELLSQLAQLREKDSSLPDQESLDRWWQQINEWREAHGLMTARRYADSDLIMPQQVIESLYRATNGEAYVTSDVGQHQMIACRYADFSKTKSNITSGGLGTMGFGLPAAIGAKMAAPEREVISISGDGGYQMTIQELGTIFQTKTAVKVVVLNNEFLGMVRQWQQLFFDKRYASTEMTNPDFVAIAKGYFLNAKRVTKREELANAVAEMVASKEAYFLEVCVEKEDNVFPMVPSGASVSDIRLA